MDEKRIKDRNSYLIESCLKKSNSYLDFPFGEDTAVIKVKPPKSNKGKIFAMFSTINGIPKATFCCTVELGIIYKNKYPEFVERAYHWPKASQPYYYTVVLEKASNETLKEMIDNSYDSVVAKYPKYLQNAILEDKNQKT